MSKENQVLELISGYVKGFITDQECSEMCDLILNEITTITEDDKDNYDWSIDNEGDSYDYYELDASQYDYF